MFSISTSWNAAICANGKEIVSEIKALGINKLELGFSLCQKILQEILKFKKNGIVQIESVHNFCPVPPGYEPLKFMPDYFSLSSLDEEKRRKAVELTIASMYTAQEAQAKALIIHAGRVEIEDRLKELAILFIQGLKQTKHYQNVMKEMIKERAENKKPFFTSLLRSLEELLKKAEKLGLNLCLENRFYYREIPSLDEIGKIFAYFANSQNLFYWHDIGHAQVAENLGISSQLDYLNSYAKKMLGIHLHDVKGTQDHKVPGEGDFDFSLIKPYLKNETLMVLEVHQPATAAQMAKGISYLRNIFNPKFEIENKN